MLLDNHSVASYLPLEVRRRLRESRRGYLDGVALLISRAWAAFAAELGDLSDDHGILRDPAALDEPTPMIAALLITGMCEEVHTWYRPDGPLTADQVADQVWLAARRIAGLPVRTSAAVG